MRAIVTLLLALAVTACHNDTVIIDSKGQSINLSKHPQQWLMINYWASWCSHCRDEIAELNIFYQQHQQQVLLYGVNYDRLSPTQLRQESLRMGIDYPLLSTDPAALLHLAPIDSLPVTFVYDPSGTLRHVLHGPQTQSSLLAAME